jgi:hypothetical protein
MRGDAPSGRSDPVAELKRGWPLDMIAPLDDEAEAAGGLLLGRWGDLSVEDLPPSAQAVALADHPSWPTIAAALTTPESLAYACDAFVEQIRNLLLRSGGDRGATISLARAGLASDEVPTLEQIGRDWDLTRERVRQLARDVRDEAKKILDWRAPLYVFVGAYFVLHPRTPFVIDAVASPDSARGRILKLALDTIGLPRPSAPFRLWTETEAQRRAVEAVIDALPELLPRARSFVDLAALAVEALPHVDETLDLAETLPMLAERLDFGPALDGRFAFGYAAVSRRVADKTVTYLQRRAAPTTPADLAQVIRRGAPPFEPLHRPLVEPDWLTECALRNPDRLQLLPDSRIALARQLAHLRPTGNVGILHSIVVDHGEPMRMIDLCDRAAHYGMSRNQVGVFIHSGRAASLFMLTRGIVGLIGRDEGANPADYRAAGPSVTRRVRVGEEIGFDEAGRIAADVEIRRSIREQGFGLPWPFSVLHFSDRPQLEVDGERQAMSVRANGDLDLPQLHPGSQVRLRLTVTTKGHLLSVETAAGDSIAPVKDAGSGSRVPAGLPSADDRPGWVDVVLDRTGTRFGDLGDVLGRLPSSLASRRRLRTLYALVALGLVQPTRSGWVTRQQRKLPDELADAFAVVRNDPLAYAALPPEQQAAVGWLVRATWLVPNIGWTRVRANDLADAGAEDDDYGDATPAPTSPRETALMRIVEAAHQASDLRRHPGGVDSLEATRTVVRRYLTALGYTAYNAVREVDGVGPNALSVHRSTGEAASALWLLLPLGEGIRDADIRQAQKAARTCRIPRAVVTDGVTLVAREAGSAMRIDLRTVGRRKVEFDRLAALAADPAALTTQE